MNKIKTMHNFRELMIWKKGVDIATDVILTTKEFPKEAMYGLSSQMNRSSVSISSNIAEGSARTTNKEFSRFLDISQGSSYELETQLVIANKVDYLSEEKLNQFIKDLNELEKMIRGFQRSIY